MLNLGARTGPMSRAFTRLHGRVYRRSRGRLGARWFGGTVMTLETVGRRSGRPRSTAVIYLADGESLIVTAANAGAHRVPAWWLNLVAAGEAVAVVGDRRRRVRPRVAEGEERDRLWRRLADAYPVIGDYQRFTDREFPVAVLEPVD
jgi:deazaflavin-dependent oxidoreductase (nitroreductase family)